MDIFDPLVGVGRPASSAELGNKSRGTSFADKLFIPFSGKFHSLRSNNNVGRSRNKRS